MSKIKLADKIDVFTYIAYMAAASQMKKWNTVHLRQIYDDSRYSCVSCALNELRYIMERPWDMDGNDRISEKDFQAYDSYDLTTAILSAAAFDAGYWKTELMAGINGFIESLPEDKREDLLQSISARHYCGGMDEIYELHWGLFGNFMNELCPAYRKFNKNYMVNIKNVSFQLTRNEAYKLAYWRMCYGLPEDRLPDMWLHPSKYVMPESDEPFTVTKNHKNVVKITDGALTVCLKLLSDRKHMVMQGWYSNGVPVDAHLLHVRLDEKAPDKGKGLGFFETEEPYLYELFPNQPDNYCGGPCIFMYRWNKRVRFSF